MNYPAFYLFIIVGMINTIHLGLYIGGANMYDVWQFRRQKALRRAKRSHGKRPLVSVIVPAHNEELVIERCMDSIRRSTTRKIEVIVHNDRSTDATRRILAAYQRRYPKFNLRVVNRRHQAGKADGVNYCIQRYAKGELVMMLDADCILRPDAIKNAIAYFDDPRVQGVAANVRLMDKRSVLGVLQKFEHMIGYRSKKFYTMANCEFIVGGVASTYRRSILDQVGYYDTDTVTEDIGLSMKIVALGNRQHRIVYGVDVVASTESVHSMRALLRQRYRWKLGSLQTTIRYAGLIGRVNRAYSPMLTLYRLPMAFVGELLLLMQPLMLSYILYLSWHYRTVGLFLGAYATITMYVLLVVWPDEHSSVRRKIAMSLYAPVLYFVFYIMDAVQVISIIRCLLHPKALARRVQHASTWVSPERVGQEALFT